MNEKLYTYTDPETGEKIEAIIKEAQPIVRCKDCKYWENKENAVWCRRTAIGIFRMEEEDFCSKGVKR